MINKNEKYDQLFEKYHSGDDAARAKGQKLHELINKSLDLCPKETDEHINLSQEVAEIIAAVTAIDSEVGKILKRDFNGTNSSI